MAGFNRRQFIQLSAGTALSSAFSRFSLAQPNKKVGVALLGLGNYSENLLAPALQHTKYCELRGIVTGSPHKIPRWQQKYDIKDSNIYSYDNLHQIANNPEIDVVYVVVPTGLHMRYSLAAANAGKHVWCEKPMAMDVGQCARMIETCNKNKVKLCIGYRMQHEPVTQAIRAYHQSKPFGDIQRFISEAGYAGNGAPADYWRMQKAMGGGAMYDMGVYPLNGARYISGQEPVAVTAHHEKSHPDIFKEVDETTYFTLEFTDGPQAECATSVVKGFNQLQMSNRKGWYRIAPMQSYTGVKAENSLGKKWPAFAGMQQTRQMDDDALAILNNTKVMVPGEEGMRDIHIIEKIFEAAKSGKRMLI
ncbi:Gfo/Idh/MocA family protein [Neptunicella marina]|uniref:Gfo/Idh/MocA family oxidoreductase n=1 Tax=Neptunicella marina TaxID=2125989 RepID=A0A8J6ITM6_9ALTE|nr:Gfo/Idh/MocA family oxidoreductase [Neptunicella marina]MBC3765193.1 Gfo/Idh/MocA family oxidoreductase [Neptunicella marina]